MCIQTAKYAKKKILSETCMNMYEYNISYGSGHEGAAVLLPGFALNW